MPTGLKNDQVDAPKGAIPHNPPLNVEFVVTMASDWVPVPCPAFRVPAGATVHVRGNNGTTGGNAANVYVGLYRDAVLKQGAFLYPRGARAITIDTDVIYPIDNTGTLWVSGLAGDGITVSVQRNAS